MPSVLGTHIWVFLHVHVRAPCRTINWEQTWVIFYVLNPEYLDLFLTKMLEISQFCMIHKYKIYLILKIISKVMRFEILIRVYCQFLVLRSACIESSQWFVNASYCPLCWTCMELEWSLGLRADVGEPAGQFWHTRHAAQLVVEGALFLHAAGLGKDGRRCLCQGVGPSLRGLGFIQWLL